MNTANTRLLRWSFVIFAAISVLFVTVTAADFRAFKIGDIDCISLSDGYFVGPPQPIAPEIPKAELEAFLVANGEPADNSITPLGCLFLRLPESGKNVLVDTGIGEWFQVPTAGKLLQSFKEAGLNPEDVEYVLISHLHQDHVNGAFDTDGKPAFPNATYYVSKEEVDFWENPDTDLGGTLMAPPFREQVIANARRFVTLAGSRLHTFPAGSEAIPGVKTIPLPGHTPGQVGFLFQDRGESLLYTADMAGNPFVSLQRPDWRFQNDENTVVAAQTRKDVAQMVMKEGWNVFASHFPAGGFGRIEDESGKIMFVSEAPAAMPSPRAPLNAIDVYNEFKRNRQEADRAYAGKRFEVTGIVTYKGLDVHHTPSIELSNVEGGKSYVLFVFDSFDRIGDVAVGDTVVLSGNFHLFGSDDWVVFKQSALVKLMPQIRKEAA